MKPGWEDLVRKCIQRFHLQNDGEMSFAKKHQQEGERENSGCFFQVGRGFVDVFVGVCFFEEAAERIIYLIHLGSV